MKPKVISLAIVNIFSSYKSEISFVSAGNDLNVYL